MPTVQITNDGSEQTTYEFTVDGAISESAGIGSGDTITDNGDGTMTASGFVNGGTDEYSISGTITDFTHTGNITVIIDGNQVDPSTLGTSDSGSDGSSGSDSGSVTWVPITVQVPVDWSNPTGETQSVTIRVPQTAEPSDGEFTTISVQVPTNLLGQ